MKRTLPPLAVAALVALIGLISAGCGSNAPSDPGTAGSSGHPASAHNSASASSSGTGGGAKLTARDKAVRFAECMRAHGYGAFPDPDAKGDFNFGVSVSPAVFKKAVDACKSLQPPGSLSGKRTPKQQSASLRFAHCVRDTGVKDFPDPVNGEPLINTYKIPSSNKPGGMTILNAAMHKCSSLLGLAAGGQG